MSGSLYPETMWRLLVSSALDGATNMATDEAIVRAVTAGLVPPTLRLYAWEPPCLSLGRGQLGDEVDRDACARDGVDIVRRPTGGRAILHTDELTYSVVAPLGEARLEGDIVASYQRLSRGLLAALQNLDVQAEARVIHVTTPVSDTDGNAAQILNPVCFEVPSHYELTAADGRKLVGSAQMRTAQVVLQHGTVPLAGDIARICRYLVAAPDPERVRSRAATIESALGGRVTWDEAAEAMVTGFETALNLNLNRQDLTQEERAWVSESRENKYANGAWTWRL